MPVRLYKAETKVNFTGYYSLYRDIQQGIVEPFDRPNNAFSVALRKVPEHYRRFLKKRYRLAKTSASPWRPITDSTARWRKKKYGITHRQILYVTKTLFKTTDIRYNRGKGHYEKRVKYGIIVGVSKDIRHPDIKKNLYGAVSMHARGGPRLPRRGIYVNPDRTTIETITDEFRKAHAKSVKKANSKIKSRRSS